MKWFKHLSGSLNNSIISEAIELFGGDGYLVYFGILEMLSDEFDIYNPGKLTIRMKKITKNLQLSRQKTVKILTFFDKKAKENIKKDVSFFADIGALDVVINCNRLAKLSDNHTQKLLKDALKSLQSENKDTSLQRSKKKEVRSKKKDIKEEKINNYTKIFTAFYTQYPIKKSKDKAFKYWQRLKKENQLPGLEILLNAIKQQKKEMEIKNNSGQFCPEWKHPSTWLNEKCWEDETDSVVTPEPEQEPLEDVLR